MLASIRGQTLRNLPESIRSHVLPPGRQTTMPVRTASEVRVGLTQGLGGHPVNTCIRTWTATLATRGFRLPPAEFPTTENDKSLTHGQIRITVCWLPLLILQHPLDNNHPPCCWGRVEARDHYEQKLYFPGSSAAEGGTHTPSRIRAATGEHTGSVTDPSGIADPSLASVSGEALSRHSARAWNCGYKGISHLGAALHQWGKYSPPLHLRQTAQGVPHAALRSHLRRAEPHLLRW